MLKKISDWINFIEGDKLHKQIVESLYKNSQFVEADGEVKLAGNNVITQIKSMLKTAKRFISENEIVLPTRDDVINSHLNRGVYTLTVAESLGSDLGNLEQLNQRDLNIPISDLSNYYGSVHHTVFDFNTLEGKHPYSESQIRKLDALYKTFEEKKHNFDVQQRTSGVRDYSDLKGVWEWQNGKSLTFNQIEILTSALGAIIQSSNFSTTYHTVDEVIRDVQTYQQAVKTIANRINEAYVARMYSWPKRTKRILFAIISWFINKIAGWFNPLKP